MGWGRSSLRPSSVPHRREPRFSRPGWGGWGWGVGPWSICTLCARHHAWHSPCIGSSTPRIYRTQKRNLGLTPRPPWAPLPGGGNGKEAFRRSRGFLCRLFPCGESFPYFLQWATPPCPPGSSVTSSWKPPQTTPAPRPPLPPISESSNVSSSCCLSFSLSISIPAALGSVSNFPASWPPPCVRGCLCVCSVLLVSSAPPSAERLEVFNTTNIS